MSKWEEIIKEHFYSKEGVEVPKKNVCKMGIEISSCRQCLFEALCHYQDNKWNDTAEVDQIS